MTYFFSDRNIQLDNPIVTPYGEQGVMVIDGVRLYAFADTKITSDNHAEIFYRFIDEDEPGIFPADSIDSWIQTQLDKRKIQ